MISAASATVKGNALQRKCQAEFEDCIYGCQQSEEKSQWVAIRQVGLQCFTPLTKK